MIADLQKKRSECVNLHRRHADSSCDETRMRGRSFKNIGEIQNTGSDSELSEVYHNAESKNGVPGLRVGLQADDDNSSRQQGQKPEERTEEIQEQADLLSKRPSFAAGKNQRDGRRSFPDKSAHEWPSLDESGLASSVKRLGFETTPDKASYRRHGVVDQEHRDDERIHTSSRGTRHPSGDRRVGFRMGGLVGNQEWKRTRNAKIWGEIYSRRSKASHQLQRVASGQVPTTKLSKSAHEQGFGRGNRQHDYNLGIEKVWSSNTCAKPTGYGGLENYARSKLRNTSDTCGRSGQCGGRRGIPTAMVASGLETSSNNFSTGRRKMGPALDRCFRHTGEPANQPIRMLATEPRLHMGQFDEPPLGQRTRVGQSPILDDRKDIGEGEARRINNYIGSTAMVRTIMVPGIDAYDDRSADDYSSPSSFLYQTPANKRRRKQPRSNVDDDRVLSLRKCFEAAGMGETAIEQFFKCWSKSTITSYGCAWAKWRDFAEEQNCSKLDPPGHVFSNWVSSLITEKLSQVTVEKYVMVTAQAIRLASRKQHYSELNRKLIKAAGKINRPKQRKYQRI